ncbi:ADP-ribose pyrophosphatase YjhB (NUDIX family) [Alkalihalobacillus hemicentroti]|uniref:ADP-ribose pyrophosphatase YjhB (NUDIX family) n=1 Tax=Guptibacillus hwajinpoensis TaxID=208199 RepID=A0ABU0K5B0_9BACL|nr:ADP-ribose pyrophosphatase YjhB (NUDIX family) [Alkalihalobacillus hemicentroti]
MIYRRKTYKINPNKLDEFNDFFHTYLYPNQLKHGAKLIGRWANEARNEITAIWEYDSFSHYETIEKQIRTSSLYLKAQEQKKQLGKLYYESNQDFLTTTAEPHTYHPPKHIVSAASVILDDANNMLLIKGPRRGWEIPGGQVEEGESLIDAAKREAKEESGVDIEIVKFCGVFQNVAASISNNLFLAKAVGGELTTSPESLEVGFYPIGVALEMVTWNNFRQRIECCLNAKNQPFFVAF